MSRLVGKIHREGDICSGPQRMSRSFLGESGEKGEYIWKKVHPWGDRRHGTSSNVYFTT